MIFYAKTPKRELFISELYLMLLNFLHFVYCNENR